MQFLGRQFDPWTRLGRNKVKKQEYNTERKHDDEGEEKVGGLIVSHKAKLSWGIYS